MEPPSRSSAQPTDLNYPHSLGYGLWDLLTHFGPLALRICLERQADPNELRQGQTPLWWASFHGKLKKAQVLQEFGGAFQHPSIAQLHYIPPLIEACRTNQWEAFQTLMHLTVDLNEVDVEGKTALMWACIGGHRKMARCLIEQGADIHAHDKKGRCALWYSSEVQELHLARQLVQAGANPHRTDQQNLSPLGFWGESGAVELEDAYEHQAKNHNPF